MPANPNGFDTTKFHRELGRVFGEYLQYNQKSSAILLHELGAKLSADLYMEAAALRGSQKAKIAGVPEATDYHVKRRLARNVGREAVALRTFKKGKHKGQYKSESLASQIRRSYGRIITAPRGKTRQLLGLKHVSIEDEIRLRQRFAAFYQASGWLSPIVKSLRNPFRMKSQAVVVEQLEGTDLRITVTNPRPNSAEFAESTGYLEAAFAYRVNQMLGYIQRKIYGDVAEFNKPRPNFGGKDVASAVNQALGGKAA